MERFEKLDVVLKTLDDVVFLGFICLELCSCGIFLFFLADRIGNRYFFIFLFEVLIKPLLTDFVWVVLECLQVEVGGCENEHLLFVVFEPYGSGG